MSLNWSPGPVRRSLWCLWFISIVHTTKLQRACVKSSWCILPTQPCRFILLSSRASNQTPQSKTSLYTYSLRRWLSCPRLRVEMSERAAKHLPVCSNESISFSFWHSPERNRKKKKKTLTERVRICIPLTSGRKCGSCEEENCGGLASKTGCSTFLSQSI